MDTAMLGHNSGGLVDPALLESLRTRVEEFSAAARKWGEHGVSTREDAEACADFISGARALYREIEDARKAAKEPHMERAKAVDETFKPLAGLIEKAANAAKELQAGFLRAEKRREEERLAAERAAAEKARAEAEARARAAEKAGQALAAEEARLAAEKAAKAAEKAAEPAKVQAKSASGGGRTISLRTVRKAVITSRRQAFLALEKEHGPEFDEVIIRLANARIRAAKGAEIEIPGIAIEIEEVAA